MFGFGFCCRCGGLEQFRFDINIDEQLSRLEFLQLSSTNSLHSLVSNKNGNGGLLAFPSTGTFARLKSIEIRFGDKMKNLFPAGLLQNLQNLEKIEVKECDGVMEIVASDEENSPTYSSVFVTLAKLRELRLIRLPRLESIYSDILI